MQASLRAPPLSLSLFVLPCMPHLILLVFCCSPFVSYVLSSLCTPSLNRVGLSTASQPDSVSVSDWDSDKISPLQTGKRSDLKRQQERARERESARNLRSSKEIYSGNKILFAPLVDGTINSSGIRPEHVLQLARILQLLLLLLLPLPLFAAVLDVAFYVACLTTYYMFMLRFWAVFQGR